MTDPTSSPKGIPQDLLDNILKAADVPLITHKMSAEPPPSPTGKKMKILWLSDHPLAVSGVGVQARFLIEGLLATGKYTFQCLGGAIKHNNYDIVQPKPGWLIKPVDGFGTKPMIRELLLEERPDAVFLFTDPRQFVWLWEMEDEIRQVCPIVYWHVWDNGPYPEYNKPWYESTDLINCISWKTYELVKEKFPEKTNYVPHAFPRQVYNRLPPEQVNAFKATNLGTRKDDFIALWVNRNATRKMPNDILFAWRMFLDNLERKYGHQKALLLMHTEPMDPEGPNLLAVTELLNLQDHVWFSNNAQSFEAMNMLYNTAHVTVNIAKAEGFSLSSLSSLQVGKPVISLCTGGLTRQVIDWRDGFQHGVALPVRVKSLVGSQMTPYIYEDFTTHQDLAEAFMKIHDITPEDQEVMAQRCMSYVDFEFGYQNMVNTWDKTLTACIENFKAEKKAGGVSNRWSCTPITRLKVSQGPGGPPPGPQTSPPGGSSTPSPGSVVVSAPQVAGDITSLARQGMIRSRKA